MDLEHFCTLHLHLLGYRKILEKHFFLKMFAIDLKRVRSYLAMKSIIIFYLVFTKNNNINLGTFMRPVKL